MVQAAQEPQAVVVQPGFVVQHFGAVVQTGLLTFTGAQTVALQGAAQVGSVAQPESFLLKQENRPFLAGVAQVGSLVQTVVGAQPTGAQPESFLLKQENKPFLAGVAQVGSLVQTAAGAQPAGAQPESFLLKQENKPFLAGVAQVGSVVQTAAGAQPTGAQPESFLLKQENNPRGFGELAQPVGAQAESPQTGFVLQTVFGAQAELVVQTGAGAAQPHSASFLKQSNSPAWDCAASPTTIRLATLKQRIHRMFRILPLESKQVSAQTAPPKRRSAAALGVPWVATSQAALLGRPFRCRKLTA